MSFDCGVLHDVTPFNLHVSEPGRPSRITAYTAGSNRVPGTNFQQLIRCPLWKSPSSDAAPALHHNSLRSVSKPHRGTP